MKIELIDTVTIAGHWLPAIVNDDWSGLTDDDCEQLEEYLKGQPVGMMVECVEFDCFARDCVSGLMSDCVEVEIYAEVN